MIRTTLPSALLSIFAFASFAQAQTVNVKDIPADKSDSTTIEIRKGDKAQKTEILWEVIDGNADISGEHNAVKEARADWKKACDSWVKEFKAENKENKIINVSCGSPTCVSETEGTLCKSQGKYKVKTRTN